MTIFKKHYIQNEETGKKCRVHYSLDNRCNARKCVTIYAKSCLDEMSGIISFENHSEPQSDYIVGDIAVIFEGDPQYEEARIVAEKIKFDNNKKWEKKYGVQRAGAGGSACPSHLPR